MMEERSTPEVDGKQGQTKERSHADLSSLPPVEIIAVDTYKGEAHHEAAPQQPSYPVDAEQGDEHGSTNGAHKKRHRKHHQPKQTDDKPVHIFPLRENATYTVVSPLSWMAPSTRRYT